MDQPVDDINHMRAPVAEQQLRAALDTMRAMYEAATGQPWTDKTSSELVAAMAAVRAMSDGTADRLEAALRNAQDLKHALSLSQMEVRLLTDELAAELAARIRVEARLKLAAEQIDSL